VGLFSRVAPKARSVETLLLPGDFELWLRGSTFHQNELKSLGTGKQRFLLVPEPGNRVDKDAVALMGISKSGLVLCGYLPKDQTIKPVIRKLAEELTLKGWAPVIDGLVEKKEGQLVATLLVPNRESCDRRMEEWRKAVTA